MNSYESAVGQLLVRRINEQILERMQRLAAGSIADPSDLPATASTYIREVAFIQGLRECLEICKEIESDLRKSG